MVANHVVIVVPPRVFLTTSVPLLSRNCVCFPHLPPRLSNCQGGSLPPSGLWRSNKSRQTYPDWWCNFAQVDGNELRKRNSGLVLYSTLRSSIIFFIFSKGKHIICKMEGKRPQYKIECQGMFFQQPSCAADLSKVEKKAGVMRRAHIHICLCRPWTEEASFPSVFIVSFLS